MPIRPRRWALCAATIVVTATACRGAAVPAGGGTVTPGPGGSLAVVQERHTARVSIIAPSPSGKTLATASLDGTVKLWDPVRRRLLRTLNHGRKTPGRPPFVAWMDAGRLLVPRETSDAGTYEVHDVDTGAHVGVPDRDDRHAGLRRATGTPWLAGPGDCVKAPSRRCAPAVFSPTLERLAAPWSDVRLGDVQVSRDGRIVFAASAPDGGPSRLLRWVARESPMGSPSTRRDLGGERLATVELGADGVMSFALAPAGDLVWVTTTAESGNGRVVRAADAHEVCRSSGRAMAQGGVFSPDGRRVVTRLGARLVALDTGTCGELWSSVTFAATALAFSEDGARLFAADHDGQLYELDPGTGGLRGSFGEPLRPVPNGGRSEHLAFPSLDTVITSGDPSATVAVWSLTGVGLTAVPRAVLPRLRADQPTLTSAHHVTRSAQGDLLFTLAREGPGSGCGRGQTQVLLSRRAVSPSSAPEETIPQVTKWPPGPGEDFAFCTSFGPIQRLGTHPSGRMWAERGPGAAPDDLAVFDLASGQAKILAGSGHATEARFSRDGSRVSAIWGGSTHVWDTVRGSKVTSIRGAPDDPSLAATLSPNGAVAAVRYAGRVEWHSVARRERLGAIEIEATALAFGADGSELLVGDADGVLSAFRDGKLVARKASAGGTIWSLETDPTGARAATISDDGGLRLWATRAAEPLARLLEFDDGEWAFVTEGGAYHASPAASDRFGWTFFSPLEHFSAEHFRPLDSRERVQRLLQGGPASTDLPPYRLARPPQLELLDPPASAGPSARFRLRGRAHEGFSLRAFVDGREVASSAVDGTREVAIEVPLRVGRNRVTFVAVDRAGFASNALTHDLESHQPERGRPSLWGIAVGVSRYPALPARYQLPAAANDARGVARLVGELGGDGKRYQSSHVRLFEDATATREAVQGALDELSAMRPEDVAIVFFAGHGIKPPGADDLLLLTGSVAADAEGLDLDEPSARARGLAWRDLGERLSRAKGRVIVLLDACHADRSARHAAHNEDLARALTPDGRGLLVFAAAKGRETSLEPANTRALTFAPPERRLVAYDPEAPHGFFTGAVLRALADPRTDRDHDGLVGARELFDEVTQRVVRASERQQTPWVARPDLFVDFALAPAGTCAAGTTWSRASLRCEPPAP